MSFTAVIAAYQPVPAAPGGLRACLPVAGGALVEQQARTARAAGAARVLLLADAVPAELGAALARLAADGLRLELARSVFELANLLDPVEQVLLLADGLFAAPAQLRRLLPEPAPALLVAPDAAGPAFERIDADVRWAGVARLDGAQLRHVSRLLGDWDLQSTVLRLSVQAGARRAPAGPEALAIVDDAGALAAVAAGAVRLPAARGRPARAATAVHQFVLDRLYLSPVRAPWLAQGAAALPVVAAAAAAFGRPLAAVLLLLPLGPLEAAARRLAAARLDPPSALDRPFALAGLGAAAVLLLLSAVLSLTLGWGCAVLGLAALAFHAAARLERRGDAYPPDRWLATRDWFVWFLLPFALTGAWRSGLAALALLAAADFFRAQALRHRPTGAEAVS